MSNFYKETINPKTGKLEKAMWIDDHFGRHKYGVKFDDGEVYCPVEDCIDGHKTLKKNV